ncbi:leucine-rich repeat domain-containing protein [Acaryochloris sp. IP29b_bin.137]|uniref:leucine-rich repeat domain-containing protein n=1 Tax=Acaryochloris sp. IP29b_bin.137 TaxID=2969217 RepID=UPI002618B39B|nr:leucine-rich repeat domain-containing protein [Acaryochloris sp. IP29b_bin.137]
MKDYLENETRTVRKELARFINVLLPKLTPHLTTLNLRYTRVSDVSALAKLTNLTTLNLRYTRVSDVSALANLTNLTILHISSAAGRNNSFKEFHNAVPRCRVWVGG